VLILSLAARHATLALLARLSTARAQPLRGAARIRFTLCKRAE
jgi:hypothetical protein